MDRRNPLIESAIEDFDILSFLESENIDYSLEGKNIGNGWIGINPCLNPLCEDSNNHFALNVNNKTGNCWKCGFTCSLVSFIAKIKEISYTKAIEFILQESNISEDDIENRIFNILSKKNNNGNDNKKDIKEIKLPYSVDISSYMIKHNPLINSFFKERNITTNHARYHNLKIGMDGFFRGKLIIPVTFRRKLQGFQSRAMNRKEYHIEGKLKECLYNYDRIPKHSNIIIVEGFFDMVRTDDFIKKYKKDYEVTTGFSKILTLDQISLINKNEPRKVIYMFDRDAWFEYNKSKHMLNCKTDFVILNKKKDPGSMSEKEFLEIFQENKL